MKRKILTLASFFILSSAIYAQDINIQNGWQLLGATEDINVSKFDNSCIDFVWKYDTTNISNPQWQLHVANGQNYNYTGSTISSLNQGDGFWVKGNGICDVNSSKQNGANQEIINLLTGNTFYAVGQEVSDATDIWGGKITFKPNLTEMTYMEAYASDAGETETHTISIDGNRLVFGSDTDGSYTVVGENKGDYIEFTDYHGDGTIESHTRLYFDKSKADAYVATLRGGQTSTDLSALIVEKTFYVPICDNYEENGQTVINNHIETFVFKTDGTLVDTWMEDGQQQVHNLEYSIDREILSIVTSDEGVITFVNVIQATDWIEFTTTNDQGVLRFFFNYTSAEATLGSCSN